MPSPTNMSDASVKLSVSDLAWLTSRCTSVRRKIIEMAYRIKGSHVGSALSMADLVAVLFTRYLDLTRGLDHPERDYFVLSKGHGCMALYAALSEIGVLHEEMLVAYGRAGSPLGVHPMVGTPGVEFACGSLGHGFSNAIGIALAGRLNAYDNRVYVLLGDGECNEGAVWEGAMFAPRYGLDNLVAMVDSNKFQCFDRTNDIVPDRNLIQLWRTSGWSVREIDGHDIEQIAAAYGQTPYEPGKPSLIFAHTVLGKGIPGLENTIDAHYVPPTEQQYRDALALLT
jgi:transketolase